MKNLILKIDEELHKQIKIRATENGQTIKGYITTLIKRDLGIKKIERCRLKQSSLLNHLGKSILTLFA